MSRPSFLALPRPIVTCILRAESVNQAVSTIKNGEFDGAPAFAVHLEGFDRESLTDKNLHAIASATHRPVMFLRYRSNMRPGDTTSLTDDERADVLLRGIRCGAAAVDLTADMFDASPLEFTANPAAVDKQRRFIDDVHALGGECVMSSHIYEPRTCEQVLEQMKAVEARGADFAKIVTMVDTEEQFLDAIRTTLELHREMKIPFIHLCNGRFSRMHRFLSPALGNALTFCVWHYTEQYVSGQPPIQNMMTILQNYNWHIDYDIQEGPDHAI